MQSNPTLQTVWELLHPYFQNKKTAAFSKYIWTDYIDPNFGKMQLSQITTLDIMAFRKELEKKLAPQTVHHCLSQLRRMIKKAHLWNLYSGPIPAFEMPKFDNRRMRFLTPNEAQALLLTLHEKSELWHDISKFALFTGLRSCEIFHLRTYNVNLDQSLIYIVDTKNSTNRVVPLNQIALEIAQKYVSKSQQYLFLSSKGTKISGVSHSFPRAVSSLELNKGITDRRQHVVFHTLRHTFASWLAQEGEPLELVGELLGHKSHEMTKRYAHLSPKQSTRAVSVLVKHFQKVNEF